MRAKKKDTGIVYALKIMDKKFITKENKTAYVKLERIVLDQLDHPGVVRLFFTFQDTFSLCMYFLCVSFCHFSVNILIFHIFLSAWSKVAMILYICTVLCYPLRFLTDTHFLILMFKTWHWSLVKVENFLIR